MEKSRKGVINIYTIVIADMMDHYYYADLIDEEDMEVYVASESLELAKKIANDLFISKNYMWESLKAMNELDGGYDIWIYNQNLKKVYRAHEAFKDKWINEWVDTWKGE